MANYKVVLEIEVEAENPLEAAKTVVDWVKDGDGLMYYVEDTKSEKIFSVDLDEDDEDAVLPIDSHEPLIQS